MKKPHLNGITVGMLLSATSAHAQVPTPQAVPSAFGVDPVIHVMSVFRAKIEGVADIRDVLDAKAQEAVRRVIWLRTNALYWLKR